jgi:hypothetical protein
VARLAAAAPFIEGLRERLAYVEAELTDAEGQAGGGGYGRKENESLRGKSRPAPCGFPLAPVARLSCLPLPVSFFLSLATFAPVCSVRGPFCDARSYLCGAACSYADHFVFPVVLLALKYTAQLDASSGGGPCAAATTYPRVVAWQVRDGWAPAKEVAMRASLLFVSASR